MKMTAKLTKIENKIASAYEKMNALRLQIEALEADKAAARKALRSKLTIVKKANDGFSMTLNGRTLNVRRKTDRHGAWFDAYEGKNRVAQRGNMYDMQTDFAVGKF